MVACKRKSYSMTYGFCQRQYDIAIVDGIVVGQRFSCNGACPRSAADWAVAENHGAIGWVQWQIVRLALSRADYQGAAEFLSQA